MRHCRYCWRLGRNCGPVERSRKGVGLPLTATGLQAFHGEGDQAWGREDGGRLTELMELLCEKIGMECGVL